LSDVYLFHCPQWRDQQNRLREAMGDRWGDLEYALGGWSGRLERGTKPVDGPKERWKPKLVVLRAVIQYVKVTQRFRPRTLAEGREEAEEEAGEKELALELFSY
jgi:hypothetical protein